MRASVLLKCATLVIATLVTLPADALNPVSWSIDETINRGDSQRLWTAPTTVDLGFDAYDWSYEIISVSATVLGNPIDVTSLIGDSFPLIGSGQTSDLPAVLIDEPLNDPTTGTSADVFIEIDAQGIGQAEISNVMLGTIDLGLPLSIQAIRIQATVGVEGVIVETPGDFNNDGVMDNTDLNLLLANWGATMLPPEWTGYFAGPSVDNDELNFLLAGWGTSVSVPECGTGCLLLGGVATLLLRKRNVATLG